MSRRTFTDDEKAHALAVYVEHGKAEAARMTGIPAGTIGAWASRGGVATGATENLQAATEQKLATMAARKAQLAADLMADIERLRASLWQPCSEKRLMTIGVGDGRSRIEVGTVERDTPTFADQKSIMTTLAIAVDKVQILTGEATERIDHRHLNPIDEELQRLTAELEHAGPAE